MTAMTAEELLAFMRANSYREDWTEYELARLSGSPLAEVSAAVAELLAAGTLKRGGTQRHCIFSRELLYPLHFSLDAQRSWYEGVLPMEPPQGRLI